MRRYRKLPWLNPRVTIRPSAIHGRGMVAAEPIRRGEVVAVWGGNFVSRKEAERAKRPGTLIQQIDDDVYEVFSENTKGDDPTYFHNHSCNPNVWFEDEVKLSAKRDIRKGEELTVDYTLFETKDRVIIERCNCGSLNCRGKVNGRDWMLPQLQKRYKNHFIPMLNRRIAEQVSKGEANFQR